jgi:Leucine-rich repeat (LRR) protein
MKAIQKLLKERPNTKKVDLSFSQLDEVESLIEILYKFKDLEELNLSCNRLVYLP